MKILKEINVSEVKKILIIEDNESVSMYILDTNYGRIDLCFGAEKERFNFSDEELIEFSKEHFDLYYKDIEILEEYWENHDK